MRIKKGQITMFIIIGLIVLIVLAFLLFISNTIRSDQARRNVEVIGSMFVSQGKYHGYVQSCIEQGMKKGLFLLGMQGGVIYDYQANGGKHYLGPGNGYPYGKYILPYGYDGIVYNVSYGITSPQLGSLYHPDVPYYPYGLTRLISNPRIISPFYVNVFGNFPSSPLTPLCDYNGANKRSLSDTVACETYDSRNVHDKNSVQEYLETYIENYTMECVRLKDLPELSSANVKKGSINATVTFGESHVFADVTVPIFIELGGIKSVIQLKDFHVRLDVRLKKIHELLSHLIKNEVNNIFFNIVRDASSIDNCKDITGGNAVCLRPGMEVIKKSNVCLDTGLCTDGNYDDVLIIRDKKSLINGKPYIFQVAIQNRPPALDLIRKEVGTGSYDYDYVVFNGDEIKIEPVGIDPDEDQHNALGFMDHIYHYYGWKEDYDEYYDPLCGNIYDSSCQEYIPPPPYPRNWSRSADYLATDRTASYRTDNNDIGVHTVKVEVCDEGGLCDYQAVIVLVSNGSFVGGSNDYADIPQGYSSLEDPYNLTSPMTAAYTWTLPYVSWHKWNISYETSGIPTMLAETEASYLPLPNIPYTIENIKSIITSGIAFFPSPQNYTTSVDIFSKNTNTGELTIKRPGGNDKNVVQVKECLPHRSVSPPYPYNTVADPFQANHSCCIGDPLQPDQPGWGTYAAASQVCYSDIEYGCREDTNFKNYADFTQTRCTDPDVDCINPAVPLYSDGFDNDIYKREFTRSCDGSRGNMCLGQMKDTRTDIKECNECQSCVYSASSEPDCKNLAFGEKVCNTAKACTKGNAQPYSGMPGPFACQASCSFGECNASINCACNSSFCGAHCDSDSNLNWSGSTCTFNCNDFLHKLSPGGIEDCELHSLESTICSSPNITDAACFNTNFDGTDYRICPSDPLYTKELNSQSPIPVSYCLNSNQCYYGVACTGDGASSMVGDFCPPAGTAVDKPATKKDLCYYNPSGEVSCDYQGKCSSSMEWGLSCIKGDPANDGYCTYSSKCYYHVSCNPTVGWQWSISSCDPYDDGTTCYYDASCTAGGCSYKDDDDSTCAVGTPQCSSTGWRCVV